MVPVIVKSRDEEFQSPDGDFVYSDRCRHSSPALPGSVFQSPDGDFVYSDRPSDHRAGQRPICFNPLTGISSILTCVLSPFGVDSLNVSIP